MMRTMLSGLRSRFGADVVIGDSVLAVALAAASVWFVLALRPQGTGIDAVTVALVVLGCLPVALRRRRACSLAGAKAPDGVCCW